MENANQSPNIIMLYQMARLVGLPAIALTAYTRTEDRIKAITAGFKCHLSKPADGMELMAMVASLAGREPASSLNKL